MAGDVICWPMLLCHNSVNQCFNGHWFQGICEAFSGTVTFYSGTINCLCVRARVHHGVQTITNMLVYVDIVIYT